MAGSELAAAAPLFAGSIIWRPAASQGRGASIPMKVASAARLAAGSRSRPS